MLVLDTSAVVELLLRTSAGSRVSTAIGDHTLHAPELLGVEVVSVLRRLVASEQLAAADAVQAIADLAALGVETYEHAPLLARMFELRHTMTAYDAAFVSLAEGLAAPVLTCDAKLAAAPGHRAAIDLVSA